MEYDRDDRLTTLFFATLVYGLVAFGFGILSVAQSHSFTKALDFRVAYLLFCTLMVSYPVVALPFAAVVAKVSPVQRRFPWQPAVLAAVLLLAYFFIGSPASLWWQDWLATLGVAAVGFGVGCLWWVKVERQSS